ncbi:MAG: CvpA family protein [Planctomycetota bacterium]
MIFNLIVIALVLGLTYAWMVRGFFNAFIQLVCTVVAGAVAFAVWEPLAYLLVNISKDRGFLSLIADAAWGIALIIPFSVVLIVLRVISDKVIKANIKNVGAVDYAGGGLCGAVIGVICAGITTIGVQSIRVPSDFLGYQPLWYTEDRGTGGGSLVLTDSLWLPADKLTGWIYSGLSVGSMSSGEPLNKWYPYVHASGISARVSAGNGAGRNTIKPEDFRVHATYSVATADNPQPTADLLTPRGGSTPQRYTDVNGDTVAQGHLLGYILEFEPGAKESAGKSSQGSQVIVSNGQVSLITEDQSGATTPVYPVAVISEGERGDEPGQLGRWAFDSREVFISSIGGQSKVKMGFEFVVPQGHTPIALMVRQTRRLLDDSTPEPMVLDSAGDRDLRIRSGSIFDAGSESRTQRDDSLAVRIDGDPSGGRTPAFRIGDSIGESFASQTARSRFDLDEANLVLSGEAKFLPEERAGRGTSRELRVDRFAVGRGQVLVQIDVSLDQPITFLGEAARSAPTDEPIVLIDSRGGEYEAIGYTYVDRTLIDIRYTPGSTLSGIADTPAISSARDDQKLTILIIVTEGVRIEQLAVGDMVLATFSPPMTAEGP